MNKYLYLGLMLTGVIFALELIFPWSSVGIFYAIVILFSQRSRDQFIPYIFAVTGSVLTLVGLIFTLPEELTGVFLMNDFLQLILLWTVTFVGRDQSMTRRQMEKRLTRQANRERERLEQVLNFEETLNNLNSLKDVTDYAIKNICAILESDRCSFMMIDDETQTLYIKGQVGLRDEIVTSARVVMGNSISGYVVKQGKPLLVKDITADDRFMTHHASAYRTKSFISVPIKLNGQVVGVFSATERKRIAGGEFNELDLKILAMLVRQIESRLEHIRRYQELNELATTDPMTGLFNFRYFKENLEKEIERSKRYQSPLSILMMDVDNFKTFNDSYGHLAGDELLKSIASMTQSLTRSTDLVCRYAGDEFVIILPETDTVQAASVAQKIQTQISNHFKGRRIGVSVGSSSCQKDDTHETIVSRADQALYENKRKNKQKVKKNKVSSTLKK